MNSAVIVIYVQTELDCDAKFPLGWMLCTTQYNLVTITFTSKPLLSRTHLKESLLLDYLHAVQAQYKDSYIYICICIYHTNGCFEDSYIWVFSWLNNYSLYWWAWRNNDQTGVNKYIQICKHALMSVRSRDMWDWLRDRERERARERERVKKMWCTTWITLGSHLDHKGTQCTVIEGKSTSQMSPNSCRVGVSDVTS